MRIIRIVVIVMVLLFAWALPASADMGPKPSITVTLENAPEEDYLIDLLMPEGGWNHLTKQDLAKYDVRKREMLETLLAYSSEDGMTARIGSALETEFAWGKGAGTYSFGYNAVPDDFRVIIITESGRVIVSEKCHRMAYFSEVTYDVSAGTLKEDRSRVILPHLVRFTVTLTATLIIEGIVFLLFKYRFREGKNGKVFLLTNLGTQLFLYIVIELFPTVWMIAELLIAAAEAFIYSRTLTPKDPRRAAVYALFANLLSFLLGLPVWFVVFFIIRA